MQKFDGRELRGGQKRQLIEESHGVTRRTFTDLLEDMRETSRGKGVLPVGQKEYVIETVTDRNVGCTAYV